MDNVAQRAVRLWVIVGIFGVGLLALMASYAVDLLLPAGEPASVAATVVLLAVVGICFVASGIMARRMRGETSGK